MAKTPWWWLKDSDTGLPLDPTLNRDRYPGAYLSGKWDPDLVGALWSPTPIREYAKGLKNVVPSPEGSGWSLRLASGKDSSHEEMWIPFGPALVKGIRGEGVPHVAQGDLYRYTKPADALGQYLGETYAEPPTGHYDPKDPYWVKVGTLDTATGKATYDDGTTLAVPEFDPKRYAEWEKGLDATVPIEDGPSGIGGMLGGGTGALIAGLVTGNPFLIAAGAAAGNVVGQVMNDNGQPISATDALITGGTAGVTAGLGNYLDTGSVMGTSGLTGSGTTAFTEEFPTSASLTGVPGAYDLASAGVNDSTAAGGLPATNDSALNYFDPGKRTGLDFTPSPDLTVGGLDFGSPSTYTPPSTGETSGGLWDTLSSGLSGANKFLDTPLGRAGAGLALTAGTAALTGAKGGGGSTTATVNTIAPKTGAETTLDKLNQEIAAAQDLYLLRQRALQDPAGALGYLSAPTKTGLYAGLEKLDTPEFRSDLTIEKNRLTTNRDIEGKADQSTLDMYAGKSPLSAGQLSNIDKSYQFATDKFLADNLRTTRQDANARGMRVSPNDTPIYDPFTYNRSLGLSNIASAKAGRIIDEEDKFRDFNQSVRAYQADLRNRKFLNDQTLYNTTPFSFSLANSYANQRLGLGSSTDTTKTLGLGDVAGGIGGLLYGAGTKTRTA